MNELNRTTVYKHNVVINPLRENINFQPENTLAIIQGGESGDFHRDNANIYLFAHVIWGNIY